MIRPDSSTDNICSRIEIEFGQEVRIPQQYLRRLYDLFDRIVRLPANQPLEGVHWLSGHGCKPIWSQADQRFLGKAVDPHAPESGEPAFDDTTLHFETTSRRFVDAEERLKVLERRARDRDGKVFLIRMESRQWCVLGDDTDILEWIGADLEQLSNGDEITFEVRRKDMTAEEIAKLPEYEG